MEASCECPQCGSTVVILDVKGTSHSTLQDFQLRCDDCGFRSAPMRLQQDDPKDWKSIFPNWNKEKEGDAITNASLEMSVEGYTVGHKGSISFATAEPRTMETESLGEALPKECARVRGMIADYTELEAIMGNRTNCQPAIIMMETALRQADEAMISGDAVAMIRVYNILKDFS